jgi:hypothetical protein
MEKTSTGKSINQKQGPRTGNAGFGTKREDFMAEKSRVSSERAGIARMITDALETRGRDNKSHRAPGVESLHDTTNVGRGPVKGNAGKTAKKGK